MTHGDVSIRNSAETWRSPQSGIPLRDVQDAAGHVDPRTTRHYDRAWFTLDRFPDYELAAYLAPADGAILG